MQFEFSYYSIDAVQHNLNKLLLIIIINCKIVTPLQRTWLCDGYPDCSSAEDEVDCLLQCDSGQFLCPAKKNITNLK